MCAYDTHHSSLVYNVKNCRSSLISTKKRSRSDDQCEPSQLLSAWLVGTGCSLAIFLATAQLDPPKR